MKKRLFLTFEPRVLDEPILSTLTSRFGLVFNIFGATVNESEQTIALELEGTPEQLEEAISYLKKHGTGLEEAEGRA